MSDRYGFWFWLRWILFFAGSFVLSALAWTLLMQRVFGRVTGAELVTTWCTAVFGSWFLLVIPFMRKKEQIWKRMNEDQEKAVDAWLAGMGIFIGLLVLSAFVWSVILRERLPWAVSPGYDRFWAKAVFGTWLFALIPFLMFMYRQAEHLFSDAAARQTYTPRFKSVYVDPDQRVLPELVAHKLRTFQPTLKGGHLVHAVLKDGQKVPHVFVRNFSEIMGVYDREAMDFHVHDIIDVEAVDSEALPIFQEERWLRLDGRS